MLQNNHTMKAENNQDTTFEEVLKNGMQFNSWHYLWTTSVKNRNEDYHWKTWVKQLETNGRKIKGKKD
jgi:hypothetical protein